MIIIKVKNSKTQVSKNNCVECQSLIQLTGAKAFIKPTVEMYVLQSLQGQFSGFCFLILFL